MCVLERAEVGCVCVREGGGAGKVEVGCVCVCVREGGGAGNGRCGCVCV